MSRIFIKNKIVGFVIILLFLLSLGLVFSFTDEKNRYAEMTMRCEELFNLYKVGDDGELQRNKEEIAAIERYFRTFGPVIFGLETNRYTAMSSFLHGETLRREGRMPEALRAMKYAISSTDSTDNEWGIDLICKTRLHEALIFRKLNLNETAEERLSLAKFYARKLHRKIDEIDKKGIIEYEDSNICSVKNEPNYAEYHYNLLENEEYKSYRDTVCTMIILLCILWIGIACIFLFLLWKHQKEKKKEIDDFLSNICELKIKQQELMLLEEDSKLYISELKEIKNNDIEILRRNIDGIKITNEMMELSQKEERLLNDDVVNKFHRMAKDNMSPRPEDWQELNELLILSIPSFFPTICRHKNLREDEKRLCSLVRLHFLPSEISTLLCISKQAVTTNRKRLLYKIFCINNLGAKEFDKKIMLIV